LPSGSASYTLGLSGAPGASSYTFPTVGTSTNHGLSSVLGATGLSGLTGASGVSNLLGTSLTGTTGLNLNNPLSNVTGGTSGLTSLGLGYNTSSYSTYTNPLLTSGPMKLKTLDDLDIGLRLNRGGTPCSPIPPAGWGLDSFTSGIDGANPMFMHTQSRPLSRLGLDLDGSFCEYY
jgi:RIMS-binding protein 2